MALSLSARIRRLKYTLAADVIGWCVRCTPIFDRADRPPEMINFAGHQSFFEVGDKTVALARDLAGLEAGHDVLDIGCAIARNALALHRAFGEDIRYSGFDIVPYGIAWSEKHFRKLSGEYRFDHADIYNSFYNPRGGLSAEGFEFPYADDSFDLSFATSVYTHMGHGAVAHYLAETARVTRSGGRAYFTMFGLDAASRAQIATGEADFSFSHTLDGVWVESLSEPDMAVAHDLSAVSTRLRDLGAKQVDVHPGYWRGIDGTDFQDVIVARF